MKKLLNYHHKHDKKCFNIDLLYKFNCEKNDVFFSSNEKFVVAVINKIIDTTTAKLIKKKRVLQRNITLKKIIWLQFRNICDDSKCFNFDLHCWKFFNNDRHYKFNNHVFKTWNKILNKQQWSVDVKIPFFNIRRLFLSINEKKNLVWSIQSTTIFSVLITTNFLFFSIFFFVIFRFFF